MEQDWGYRAGEAPVNPPPELMVMVAALVLEVQGLVPSEWRSAGHPQVIMASEPQTVAVGFLLLSWGGKARL